MQQQRSVDWPIVGVVGGSGGVGASSFAGALAATVGTVGVAATVGAGGTAMLVDVDVDGGGIDVVLGIESVPGARWSGLRLAGGALDPAVLVDGLPAWGGCRVLAADVAAIDPAAVTQVIDTAAQVGAVVLNLPRRNCPERGAAVGHCDLVVILARGDVAGLVAAHAVASGLPGASALGLLVRSGGRAAWGGCAGVGAREAAHLVGVELLGALPALRTGGRAFDPLRPSRAVARVVGGLLAGIADRQAACGPVGPAGRVGPVGIVGIVGPDDCFAGARVVV